MISPEKSFLKEYCCQLISAAVVSQGEREDSY